MNINKKVTKPQNKKSGKEVGSSIVTAVGKSVGKTSNPTTNSGNSLKEREKRRKQVFKPVLDNPFTTVNWPFIEPRLASDIIQHLSILLQPLGRYNEVIKKEMGSKVEEPLLIKHTFIGFNEVTKQLEKQARGSAKPNIQYVFVCKYDLSPPILYQHFPVLTYTASKGSKCKIKLIQLPRGTSQDISNVLKIQDTSIFALDGEIDQASALYELLETVKDVEVPYLKDNQFEKLQVHFLATTAPTGNAKKNNQKNKEAPKGS